MPTSLLIGSLTFPTAMGKYIEELYNKADVKITKTFESDALLKEEAAKQTDAKKAEVKK